MKLTILTPSFNQAQFIGATIESVRDQPGVEVEHIVIDGGSTDGTIEVLRRYPHLTWVSEPDGGQADALNKGLARATGDVVGWLNSDDLYVPGALAEVAAAFASGEVAWVIGNLATLYESTGTVVHQRSPGISREALFADPDIVRQQPAFFRRDLLARAGGWNARYHMAMDFDLWLRLLNLTRPCMVDRHWAIFRMHPLQKTSRRNLQRQLAELCEILAREGAGPDPIRQLRRRRAVASVKAFAKEWLIRLGLLSKRYQSRPVRLPGASSG